MSRPVQAVLRTAARSLDPYLSLLLKETHTIESATNELRWLKEHLKLKRSTALNSATRRNRKGDNFVDRHPDQLLELCKRRAKGEPLQYILGSQPFGELDIKCEPGVLIPRPETEAYTTYLASKICNGLLDQQLKTLSQNVKSDHIRPDEPHPATTFKILDACSGSGCISLLLYSLLSDHMKAYGSLEVDGADISKKALQLSKTNLERNVEKGYLKPDAFSQVRFMNYDVLQKGGEPTLESYHIIISNPPYISRLEYETAIPRSVRDWEPELALVPNSAATPSNTDPADIFYLALIEQYQKEMVGAFVLVMEIGDEEQAKRVLNMAIRRYNMHATNHVSVWRDSPEVRPSGAHLVVEGINIPTEGQGNLRAVVFVRNLTSICWADKEFTAEV